MSGPDQISPAELKARIEAGGKPTLLDVREPWEIAVVALPGIVAIPLHEIPQRWQELDPQAEIVVICRSGMRSQNAATFLVQQGITHVYNLAGGMLAWSRDVDPSLPTY
ncbi:MAG: rhodanese-like domain-containing protein [Steroidobacteraceae bacterium]|jgi:rhodanese-related sulfurtransferase